jgi:disulfide bond formation protein DsbB
VAAAATVVAVVGAAAILGAWFFQYGLGLKPCPLCLEQRYPYYFAIPLAVMVLLGDHAGARRKVLIAALGAIALGMLWNAGLGVYHAGVEWTLWGGAAGMLGRARGAQHGRRPDRQAAIDQRGALRRCRLALPRPLARRL